MNVHIVLVTYNWPPRNAIGTHRPYAWAKYWARAGARVTVITSCKQAFDEPLDLQYPTPPGVEVVEVDYKPFGTVGGGGRVALAVGKRVELLKRVKRFLSKKIGVVLDPREKWAAHARHFAASVAVDADVVVSTYGPAASHVIASRMKAQRNSLLWVADYRDLWSNSHMIECSQAAKRRERLREKSIVGKGADLVTTVSPELAEDLCSLLNKPTHVIPNGFDPEEALPVRVATRRTKCRIVYTGMLYPGTRDPSPLLRALAKLRRCAKWQPGQIVVEFYGPPNAWLQELVKSHDLEDVVKILGRVSRADALSIQSAADALLLLESGDPGARGVLTGKLFEYLAAGQPILSLGSHTDSAIGRTLRRCGAGICLGTDDDLIIQQLLTLMEGAIPAWYQPDAQEIASYSREAQAGTLLELICERLRASRRGDSDIDDSRQIQLHQCV